MGGRDRRPVGRPPTRATPTGSRPSTSCENAVQRAGADRVVPFVADVSDTAAMADAVQSAEGGFGGLDALIAIAGAIASGVPYKRALSQQPLMRSITPQKVVQAPARLAQPGSAAVTGATVPVDGGLGL
jgi:NAD(P)-dependent dehydrogenase (short-subunit alcohol dehydrogenase family)